MAKSFVLKALRIFGLEEMLKLAESVRVKSVAPKKAAGGEFIIWDDASEVPAAKGKTPRPDEDNVLPFKKNPSPDLGPGERPEPHLPSQNVAGKEMEELPAEFSSTDFLLWQRELSKDSGAPLAKKEAVKGYSKSTEMYIVKTPLEDGKEKIRFASTNGVLVNKKQA